MLARLAMAVVIVLCMFSGLSLAADFKPEVIQAAKKGTALVAIESQPALGTAFCIDASGYFVTCLPVVEGARGAPLRLVLSAGEENQRVLDAKVVRIDQATKLVLLRATSKSELPSLRFAPAAKLTETQQLAVFGYPREPIRRIRDAAYPIVSVNVVRITSLKKTGELIDRLSVEPELQRGASGGPALNEAGEVIGIVSPRSADDPSGSIIAARHLHALVSVPEVDFAPAPIPFAKRFDAQRFMAKVGGLVGSRPEYQVKLVVGEGKEKREIQLQRRDDGSFAGELVPLIRRGEETLMVDLEFDDGLIRGQIKDSAIDAGKAGKRWSNLRQILRRGDRWLLLGRSDTEESVESLPVKDLEVKVGGSTMQVSLKQARSIRIAESESQSLVPYQISVVSEGKTVVAREGHLAIEPAEGMSHPLTAAHAWPSFLDEPPAKPGEHALAGLGRRFVRTPRGDFLRKDFTFDLVFSITKADPIIFVGLGFGRNETHEGEPTKSVMFRIHSQDVSNGEVVITKTGPIGGTHLGKIPPGTHRARIRKSGDQVVFAIDVDNNGPSPEDIEHTIPNIREFAPFLDATNAYLFFGGGGTFPSVRLSQRTPPAK